MELIFKTLIEKSQTIVITTHIQPDADGIGSEISLALALRSKGKTVYCINEKPLLDRYQYLDCDKVMISHEEAIELNIKENLDLFIVTDTNNLERIGSEMKTYAKEARNLLFIDHHPCPKELRAIHCIDTSKAATGELIGNLIESIGVKLTPQMALPLYTAILIDTSSFRYPTVSGDTHRMLGKLVDTGVSPPVAYKHIYGTKKLSYMHFLGKILSNCQVNEKQNISWICLEERDLEDFEVDTEDTHGFINNLLILENAKVALMFRQIAHKVKISFRSAGDIDVGVMAQALGGGGHDHSAATIVEGTLNEVVSEVVKKVELMLAEIEKNGHED